MRRCRVCGHEKPLIAAEFKPHTNGFRHVCRVCQAEQAAARYQKRRATEVGFVEQKNQRGRERYWGAVEGERERNRTGMARWRRRHPKRALETKKRHYWRLRARVAAHLGGRCALCGYVDARALQIDHPNGGGTAHRRSKSMTAYFGDVLRSPPGTYRLLCANCNWAARIACLSARWRSRPYSPAAIRDRAIAHLGGACVECRHDRVSSLQIDHVHGGGNEERRRVPRSAYYKSVMTAPPGKFQVLCANCNWIKRLGNPAESTSEGRRRRSAAA